MNPEPVQSPFSYGYDQIYKAICAWKPLTDAVRIGNIRNLDAPNYRPRPNVNASDAPELKILERRIIANTLSQDSQGVFLKCLYPIEMRSGKYGVDGANLVSILVLQALTNVGATLGDKPSPANVIDKWEWIDASLVPNDKESRQPQYVVNGGVLVHFSMHRKDFLLTTYT